ncbi:MAG TPA: hypothetical protein VFT59_04225 [Candidatus Saccharimonadales bacterium]|nr:hypothetical protein [Candidatus Saccharimonadales bacterium]
MKQSNIIIAIVAVLIVTGAVTAGTYINDRMMEKVASKMESEEMKDKSMKEDAYTLKFLSGITYQPGQPSMLEFTVVDKDGKRLNQDQYKIEHEKRMHVIVASQDLTQFQHVHPVFDTGTNSYKLPHFVFPVTGNYRIFTDFVVDSHGEMNSMSDHAGVQYQDVIVGNPSDEVSPLGSPTTSDTANGITVDLVVKPGEADTKKVLEFTLTQNGQPVTNLQKYLGALGHLVVLREGDLEYIHTHALSTEIENQTGKVSFEVDFKQSGTYKAFAQFQHENSVTTTDFVIKID